MKSIILIICIICISCGKKHKFNAGYKDVPVISSFQGIEADSLFSSVDYVLLETDSSSLLIDINKFYMTDSMIYIQDKKQDVLMKFDKTGKFIAKLDKKGRGRGEYLSLDDFFIKDSKVYVLSSAIKKILIYDEYFDYISDFEIDSYATNIACLRNTMFLFTNFASLEQKNFYVYHLNEGKLLNKFQPFLKKQRGVSYTQSTFWEYNNEMYCFLPFDFSIYKVSEAGMVSIYQLDFDQKNMSPLSFKDFSDEERINYLKRYSNFAELPIQRIDNLFIDDHLFFFTFVKGIFPYCYIENKNKKWSGSIGATKTFPVANNKVLWVNKDKFYTYERTENFLMCKEKGIIFPSDLDDMKIDDNPVLCIYSFK